MSDFNTSETQMIKLVDKIVDKVKPVQCKLHAQFLKDLQDDVNDIGTLLGTLKKEGDERFEEAKKRHALLDMIDKKLFRSNGEICMVENVRNLKGKFDRHMENHDKVAGGWKYIIGIILAIVAAMGSLGISYSKGDDHHEVEDLKEIVQELIKSK